jgi:alanine-synthesizing transaminase
LGESGLSGAIRSARANGLELFDLTISNPTVCGFRYEVQGILGALQRAEAMVYDPDPRGMWVAREAVATYYADAGVEVSPAECLLTTSTSEAYSFLFRLLCDAGDEVLVAQPSYPLFDFLAGLDDVRLESYPLFYDYGWWIDFAELERKIGPRTRAVLVVHPNNPTGHATSRRERERLQELCVRHGLALIVDEVFLDYGLAGRVESFAGGEHPCLTFVVSGLSKVAALPQMKVGWMGCFGPESMVRGALERLEVIADTFLSMNAPAQLALPEWLAGRKGIQGQILERVRENLTCLDLGRTISLVPVEAGWSVVLRVPQSLGGAGLAEILVNETGVVVHPGSFYGMSEGNRIVVSLIGDAERFREGIAKIERWCESTKLTGRR